MKIKLNYFEPSPFLSDNAYTYYSNSDYKIAIEEHEHYNLYYILLNNDVVCGPADWVEVQEFLTTYTNYF